MPTPAPTVIPALQYDDAPAAIEFLTAAFGFEAVSVHEGPDGTIAHAELRSGTGMVMLGSRPNAREEERIHQPAGGSSIYVIVDDADAHFERATKAAATITRPIRDTEYGSREYTAEDLEGNLWSFGTYRPSLDG